MFENQYKKFGKRIFADYDYYQDIEESEEDSAGGHSERKHK